MHNELNLKIPQVQSNIKLPHIVIKFPKNTEYKTTFNPWLNVGILQIFYLNHLKTSVLKLASRTFEFRELIDPSTVSLLGAVFLIYCFKMLGKSRIQYHDRL